MQAQSLILSMFQRGDECLLTLVWAVVDTVVVLIQLTLPESNSKLLVISICWEACLGGNR